MTESELEELEKYASNLKGIAFCDMSHEEQQAKALNQIDRLTELVEKFIDKDKNYKQGMYRYVMLNGDCSERYKSTNLQWWKIGYLFLLIAEEIKAFKESFTSSPVDLIILTKLDQIMEKMYDLKNKMISEA